MANIWKRRNGPRACPCEGFGIVARSSPVIVQLEELDGGSVICAVPLCIDWCVPRHFAFDLIARTGVCLFPLCQANPLLGFTYGMLTSWHVDMLTCWRMTLSMTLPMTPSMTPSMTLSMTPSMTRSMLTSWHVDKLTCWQVDKLTCWHVDMLACWHVDMLVSVKM